MSSIELVRVTRRDGAAPVAAVALHDGSMVRAEVERCLALTDADRMREEDPFTARWTEAAPLSIVALRSRFEFDLNRPRERAVYDTPADAWGLHVWNEALPPDVRETSLGHYDAFYEVAYRELKQLESAYGSFVVLDLHSYNHRRDGPDRPPAPAAGNPELNIGTGTMDRDRWGCIVDAARSHFVARGFDARENVRFLGGHFSRWVHETFPDTGCALPLEFKKTFMDEWTGALDRGRHRDIGDAIASLVPALADRIRTRATS